MVLITERLILRPWEDGDAADLYPYAKDERVGPMAGWAPHKDEKDSLTIIRTVLSQPETYAVVPKETGRPVGSVGIHKKERRKRSRNRLLDRRAVLGAGAYPRSGPAAITPVF